MRNLSTYFIRSSSVKYDLFDLICHNARVLCRSKLAQSVGLLWNSKGIQRWIYVLHKYAMQLRVKNGHKKLVCWGSVAMAETLVEFPTLFQYESWPDKAKFYQGSSFWGSRVQYMEDSVEKIRNSFFHAQIGHQMSHCFQNFVFFNRSSDEISKLKFDLPIISTQVKFEMNFILSTCTTKAKFRKLSAKPEEI